MYAQPDERSSENGLRAWLSHLYLLSLRLYPGEFRRRFGSEMSEVFEEAVEDHLEQGAPRLFLFLTREAVEMPGAAFDQHLSYQSFLVRRYPMNILAFFTGFLLLGIINAVYEFRTSLGMADLAMILLVTLAAGGLGSLAVGTSLNPQRKKWYVFCGALGFLVANTIVQDAFFALFPDTMQKPGVGLDLLLPFLYPISMGIVYGLALGIANRTWKGAFLLTSWGGLAFLAGYFINRLSSALMQSYLFHNPGQVTVESGIMALFLYLLIPYVLEGLLIGAVFGRSTRLKVSSNRSR